jgi:hypothetical protein
LILPAPDPVLFCFNPSLLGLGLLAKLAFVAESIGCHDKFHTTGLSGSVLSVAMLSEMAPFEVTTGKDLLLVETHG